MALSALGNVTLCLLPVDHLMLLLVMNLRRCRVLRSAYRACLLSAPPKPTLGTSIIPGVCGGLSAS